MSRSSIHIATVVLATAALGAATASARPPDPPPADTTAAPHQEQTRDSRDSADPTPDRHAGVTRAPATFPTRPAQGEQANPRPQAPAQPVADDRTAGTTIGLGIAAALLILAVIVGSASRWLRSGRSRMTA